MHFEILVEDLSGKNALDILVPKIIKDEHSFRVIAYKGIGRIPKSLKRNSDASKRILLNQLPRLLQGYGKTYANSANSNSTAVIVICDLDEKCLNKFRKELNAMLKQCQPKPEARFCIAIEEGEAWFLGDPDAIKRAYPTANSAILAAYKNDSICGTWETLADAVFPGGSTALSNKGWQAIGAEKSNWAEKITPCMDVNKNISPSFNYFYTKIRELIKA